MIRRLAERGALAVLALTLSGLAGYAAEENGAPWLSKLRHTVSLGTPHLGAPLARGVHMSTAALRFTPVTRPFGEFFDALVAPGATWDAMWFLRIADDDLAHHLGDAGDEGRLAEELAHLGGKRSAPSRRMISPLR